jgi:hypothetical protein
VTTPNPHALARDFNILLDALKIAVRVIEGLEDQQAMPDDWYFSDLVYLRALVEYTKPVSE